MFTLTCSADGIGSPLPDRSLSFEGWGPYLSPSGVWGPDCVSGVLCR